MALGTQLVYQCHDIHFEWIPTHVDLYGNAIADKLAKMVVVF